MRPLQIGETKVSPNKAVASYQTPHKILLISIDKNSY